jgi:CheY-like chemotaxis protein
MAGTSNQNVIISITGESTGIQKAAKSGAQALQQLNQRINDIVLSNARWDDSTKKLRIGTLSQIDVVNRAKQVAAQLTAERARAIKVNEMLTASLTKQELALLRSNGLMQGMSNASGSASFALLSLTQGIQDAGNFGMGAAQGIRAVNNNIQSFVTAATFAASQTEGGIVAVFKNMGKAMIGPAGILFAFSVVSAAVEFFANKSQTAKSDVEDLTKAWEDAAGSMIEFQDVMDGNKFRIPESALKGVAETLRAEVETIDKARARGADAIIGDKINSIEALASAYLRASAEAINNEGAILKLETERLANNEEILAAQKLGASVTDAELEANRALLKQFDEEIAKNERLRSIRAQLEKQGQVLSDKPDRLREERVELTEIEKLERDILETRSFIYSSDQKRIASLSVEKQYLTDLEEITSTNLELEQRIKDLTYDNVVSGLIEIHQQEEYNKELRETIRLWEIRAGIRDIELPDWDIDLGSRLETDADRAVKALDKLNNAFENVAAQGITSMIDGLLSLATGQEKNLAVGLILPFADMAIQLGKIAIFAGLGIEKIKSAFKNLHGPTAIAAGVALVTLGSVVKSQIKQTGSSIGASSGGSSFSSPNTFSPPNTFSSFTSLAQITAQGAGPSLAGGGSSASNNMQFRFVMRGDELIGVMDNTIAKGDAIVGRGTIGTSNRSSFVYSDVLDGIYRDGKGV